MSKYIKKIHIDEYLTWVNSEGKVCPRLPPDWKDETKYGKHYFELFLDAICVKLHSYEEEYQNPFLMISEVLKLRKENDRLTKENDKLMSKYKNHGKN